MPEYKFCPYCGAEIDYERAAFCPACGQTLATDRTPPTLPQACEMSGEVLDRRRRPIANAEIEVHGTSMAGERQNFRVRTDALGKYSLVYPRGIYKVDATAFVEYHGKQWRLQLHPEDESNATLASNETSLVKNFQWRISGLVPGDDPTHRLSYYGGHIWARCSGGAIPKFLLKMSPERFVCTFTLLPVGPLIDGSDGSVLQLSRTVKALWNTSHDVALETTPRLCDIPIGQYRMTAALTAPGFLNAPVPVPLNVDDTGWRHEIMLQFEPRTPAWGTEDLIVLLGLPS